MRRSNTCCARPCASRGGSSRPRTNATTNPDPRAARSDGARDPSRASCMATTDYEVVPPGSFALLLPMVFAGLLAIGLVVLVATSHDQPLVLAGALPALLLLLGLALGFAWLIRHPRVR